MGATRPIESIESNSSQRVAHTYSHSSHGSQRVSVRLSYVYSRFLTITIPTRMWEALEKLAPLCGYRNATEMVTWSPLYSFQVPTLHMMTAPVAAMDRAGQDKAIEDA